MSTLRSAKDADNFPYQDPTTCYISLRNPADIKHFNTKSNKARKELLSELADCISEPFIIIAVWPGRWSSDAFVIDDPQAAINSIVMNWGG